MSRKIDEVLKGDPEDETVVKVVFNPDEILHSETEEEYEEYVPHEDLSYQYCDNIQSIRDNMVEYTTSNSLPMCEKLSAKNLYEFIEKMIPVDY